MINPIIYLLKENEEIYSKIDYLNYKDEESIKSLSFKQNYNNKQIAMETIIKTTYFRCTENDNVKLNCEIIINCDDSQSLYLEFLNNSVVIESKSYQVLDGINSIKLDFNFASTKANNCIYIKIRPQSIISLSTIDITIEGNLKLEPEELKYQIHYEDNKYYLYKLENKTLFSQLLGENSINFLDNFTLVSEIDDFKIIDFDNSKYLFFILNNNLFFNINDNLTPNMLFSGLEKFSVACKNDEILIVYLKGKTCFYRILSGNNLSEEIEIRIGRGQINNIEAFYNNSTNKFYICLTNESNENFLIESIDEKLCEDESISLDVTLDLEVVSNGI